MEGGRFRVEYQSMNTEYTMPFITILATRILKIVKVSFSKFKFCDYKYTATLHITHLLRVYISWQWWVVTLLYLFTERVKVHLVTVKWRLERSHLIEQAAKRPNV